MLTPALTQSPHPLQPDTRASPALPPALCSGQCTHLEVPVVHTVERLEKCHWRGHILVEGALHPTARRRQSEASSEGASPEAQLQEA